MTSVGNLITGTKKTSFNLTKQFALLSFLCILLIGTASTFMLSRLFTETILTRDATVSQDFVHSVITADRTWRFFLGPTNSDNRFALEKFFTHLTHMPDVVRANVYSRGESVLWSSDPDLIGKKFKHNEELNAALNGELVFESGIIGDTVKEEHRDLGESMADIRFIETYIPIWNGDRSGVVGAVELYKLPHALHRSITEGQRLIWISALFGGLLLFISLYWIIKRASLVMETQQQKLIESRSLAMIGETASAVAHAMRNPLASIRVCAELTLTDDLEGARESAMDIISEADRLDRWARELLQFSATNSETPVQLDINDLVRTVLIEHEATLNRLAISLHLNMAESELPVRAHPAPLSQVLGNLIMNAVEAMGEHGELNITTTLDSHNKTVAVSLRDNGPGLSSEIEDKLFRPFTTTKTTGTGLGLALSRRLLEHYDGTLEIESKPGQGVTVTVLLPISKGLL